MTRKDMNRQRVMAATIPDDADAIVDEFVISKFLHCSVAKVRADRINGVGVPFLKIGGSVRYVFGDAIRYRDSCIRFSTKEG